MLQCRNNTESNKQINMDYAHIVHSWVAMTSDELTIDLFYANYFA